MPTTLRKGSVYLTRHGRELLVLTDSLYPEAGLQVPAGTVERREAEALREPGSELNQVDRSFRAAARARTPPIPAQAGYG